MKQRPVVLCIMDGVGYREERADNAVAQAMEMGKAPNLARYFKEAPRSLLKTCGQDVGLPEGQMGNSEVGHMNIGAGRVIYQDLPMIDRAIANGEFKTNAALQDFTAKLKKSGGACHLLGLASPGGVHAHQRHMVALAATVAAAGIKVYVHAFLDGRDVAPQSAVEQIAALEADLKKIDGAQLATLVGRYYAMDRDNRWDRVEKAYNLLAKGDGAKADTASAAIKASYAEKVTDEFVLPIALADYPGMKDGDGLLMANFRADRAREILAALLDPAFKGFTRTPVKFAVAAGMVEYSKELNAFLSTLFPPKDIRDTLGALVTQAGLKQLRIAETEKYPHVTFFFNGGNETPYEGEERIMVPSPKIATYDLQPEMSAPELTEKLVAAIASGTFDLIIVNYANGDMVGHSGSLPAAIKAVAAVDDGVGKVEAALKQCNGVMLATADHGNCEMMRDPATHGAHTSHTLFDVPLFLLNGPKNAKLQNGRLADLAPTLLHLLGLPQPAAMTGKNLLA